MAFFTSVMSLGMAISTLLKKLSTGPLYLCLTRASPSTILPQQEPAQKGENEEKAPYDPSNAKDAGMRMPTHYDKFVTLDQVLTKAKVNLATNLPKSRGRY
jgi:hypothetical protein